MCPQKSGLTSLIDLSWPCPDTSEHMWRTWHFIHQLNSCFSILSCILIDFVEVFKSNRYAKFARRVRFNPVFELSGQAGRGGGLSASLEPVREHNADNRPRSCGFFFSPSKKCGYLRCLPTLQPAGFSPLCNSVWGLQVAFASSCLPVTRPCVWRSSCLRASAAAIRSAQSLSACQHRSLFQPPHSLRGGAKGTCNRQREGVREGSKRGGRCTTSSFHSRDAALPCTSHLTAFYPVRYRQRGETSPPAQSDVDVTEGQQRPSFFFFFFIMETKCTFSTASFC